MTLYHIIILALIQGITEFLPISSSGHLVLFHEFIDGNSAQNWDDNLMLDVAVHVGTLFSVMLYFRSDVCKMLCGLKTLGTGKHDSPNARLALYVLIGSLPVIIAGFAFYKLAPAWIRSIEILAWTTLLFGILLWWVDKIKPAARTVETLNLRDALFVGGAQILSLIPGTSRSGITMTAARWLGFSRAEAARYSLLLAMVAIGGAGTLSGIDLIQSGNTSLTINVLIAAALAFISGLAAISLMMHWLEKATFAIFAAYRVVLGIGLLILVYSGLL